MMEREDIAAIGARIVRDFVPPTGEDVWLWAVNATSGTTSRPIVSMAKSNFGAESAQYFLASARPIVCMGSMGMRLRYVKLICRDQVEENRVFALDAKDLLPGLSAIITDFKPDRLIGPPSFLLRVAEYIDKEVAKGVLGLHFVGEAVTPELENVLRERFPNAVMRALYGMVEFGQISKPSCSYLPRNWYHPLDGVMVEIFEPDKEGVGDILISGKMNDEVMIERYRVGDVGRVKRGFCPCGEYVSFEVLGRRGHDYIKLGGAILRQEEFDRVAAKLKTFDEYRAEVTGITKNGKLRGKIILYIFKRAGVGTAALKEEIGERFSRELFVTQTRTLADLVQSGDFLPLEVVWAQKPFEGKYKNVKLMQVELFKNI